MSFHIFFLKSGKVQLGKITKCKRHIYSYKLYLIIKKINAKFRVGENKHMCAYYKIIWVPNIKCNTHIQVGFKIIHKGFK